MSPKNKGKFGKGKSEIPETDEFVSTAQRVGEALRPYAARIAVFITVIVVGFGAFVGYQMWQDHKAKEGTRLFVQAADVVKRQVVPEDEEAPGDGDGDAADEPPPPGQQEPVTYSTLQAKAEAGLAVLKKLQSERGGTEAAGQGKLLEARALLDAGKHDQALAAFRSYAKKAPNDLMKTIAREGIGYALEAKAAAAEDAGQREELLRQALEAFRDVQPSEDGPRWHWGLYHEARLQATLGDRAKATELYQKILDSEPPVGLEEQVNARLALLETEGD